MTDPLPFDASYLKETLFKLLQIPSPAGYTSQIVHFVGEELERIGVPFELTRRGAIRAEIKGKQSEPDRAIVSHLDTLGAMVCNLKESGRLEIAPIGHWSARFAEGARVNIRSGDHVYTGTILPLKASGHIFNEEIDTQPVSWENLEVRLDADADSVEDLNGLRIYVGDYVAVRANPEMNSSGYINSRHLDDKAGVAIMLTLARAMVQAGATPPQDIYFLFTISEEVGTGASTGLHQDVAEMVAIDNATNGPGQNCSERGVTIPLMDSSGPFDYHLTQKLIRLCQNDAIEYERDVFRYYRCDAASAIESGNDMRVALIAFSVDGSHGYERTHIDSLQAVYELTAAYVMSPPVFERDKFDMGPFKGFPEQPAWPAKGEEDE